VHQKSVNRLSIIYNLPQILEFEFILDHFKSKCSPKRLYSRRRNLSKLVDLGTDKKERNEKNNPSHNPLHFLDKHEPRLNELMKLS
jgi:hypothetical protein